MAKRIRNGQAQLGALREILAPLGCTIEIKRSANHLVAEIRGPAGERHCEPIGRNNRQDETGNLKRQDARRIARMWGLLPS